jgi:thiamine-monophosphate kinase
MTMRLADLGEFGIIDRIRRLLPAPPSDVVVGIGDDVAVLDTGGPHYLLATCDIQVEDVHFLRHGISPQQLGRKVIAINVSDIAAMGGRPRWALVSLGLAPDLDVEFIDELYRGLNAQAQDSGLIIVGGNLSQIKGPLVIDLFLLGECDKDCLLRRDRAQVGDVVMVTGELGDARAGLELLLNPHLQVSEETRARVLAAHLTPIPRLAEGQLLAASKRVHAMLDVSDGVVSDLGHLCNASRVSSTLELGKIPISRACRDVALAVGANPEDWASSGGEDYQLLFTAAPADAEAIEELLNTGIGAMATVIGRIEPVGSDITLLRPDGTPELRTGTGGWNHFGQGDKS